MKLKFRKVFGCILAVTMLMSAFSWCIKLPITAAEEDEPSEDSVNYAEGLVWDKRVGGPTVKQTESGAVMSNVVNAWDSVGCDLLPVFRQALGDKEKVYLAITVEVTATMKAGSEDAKVSGNFMMRGTDAMADLDENKWNQKYAQDLKGDSLIFKKLGANIMAYFGKSLSLKHGETAVYEFSLDLTRNQLATEVMSEWVFCIDGISGMKKLESIEFKNMKIIETNPPIMDDTVEDPNNTDHLITEHEVEVWSPVEIILKSTVDYANPYLDTEIDATFTHADGTEITVPGFWKGGHMWAVRFSPTKTGEWTYAVKCADSANKGLHKEGKVTASEATSDTELSKHGFVTTVKDQHYYQHADGTPFFWLGDTHWQAPTKVVTTTCNYPGCRCGNQFKHMVDDRVEKGFNVYQTYFVPEGGLWKDDRHEYLNLNMFNDKIDSMFDYLHEKGMVIALGLGCHTATTSVVELDDFLRFTRYIVARYGCYSVVWIAGQEVNVDGQGKTPGYSSFDYYMNAAALIEELDGYSHPNSAHMWPVSANHAAGQRLDNAPWHDSWTVQGGHCGIRPKSYYESFYKANASGFTKPYVESEANYEEINCGGFSGAELPRMSAWTAMLCGSAGYTYGATGIWVSCFSTSSFTALYGDTSSYSYEPWYIGLDKPGSFEMTYLKQFFMDIGCWQDLIPCFSDRDKSPVLGLNNVVMSATEDSSVIVTYFYGNQRTSQIKILDPSKIYDVYWFNPRTGKYIPEETDMRAEDGIYTVASRPDDNDWVLLITSMDLADHYEENLPKDLNPTYAQVAPTGTKVTPKNVKAVGGISYSGDQMDLQIMTDHTKWLWDGNPASVWTPVANRTTQTFIFDLGTPQKLTHLTITPAEGTIIPTFRVAGSNDGKIWTMITDTSVRNVENPGAASEPLEGVYRYVKILLLNADPVNVGEDKLDTLPYKAMYNPMTGNCYSVTEITDVVIYSDGEGVPTPDKLVVKGEQNDQTEDTQATETTEVSTPDTDLESTTTESATTESEKSGCKSTLGAGTLAVIALSGAAVMTCKKKKD